MFSSIPEERGAFYRERPPLIFEPQLSISYHGTDDHAPKYLKKPDSIRDRFQPCLYYHIPDAELQETYCGLLERSGLFSEWLAREDKTK